MTVEEIVKKLRQQANPKNVAGMARFGINPKNTLGVSIPALRTLASEIKKEYKDKKADLHQLTLNLWETDIHEARILAGMMDEPALVTKQQLEDWVKDFDSWDVCDQVCSNLFDKTAFAKDSLFQWVTRREEYVKRAGFVLMACLAVHDKGMADAGFEKFFPLIKTGATDERNFVKKAVNWALRQMGKRNAALRKRAIAEAKEIALMDAKSARWVARDALRELETRKI